MGQQYAPAYRNRKTTAGGDSFTKTNRPRAQERHRQPRETVGTFQHAARGNPRRTHGKATKRSSAEQATDLPDGAPSYAAHHGIYSGSPNPSYSVRHAEIYRRRENSPR